MTFYVNYDIIKLKTKYLTAKTLSFKGGQFMKQLSEVSKFNELLWLLPGLADELKVAISAEIKKEAERKHALRLISEFQL